MKIIVVKSCKFIAFFTLPVLMAACGGTGEENNALESNLASDTSLAYVQRNLSEATQVESNSIAANFTSSSADTGYNRAPLDLPSPYDFNPGARLIVRMAMTDDVEEVDVLASYFQSTHYDVKDLSVSSDGRYLLFAAHGPLDGTSNYTWNIYEYNFLEDTVRRVIEDDAIANAGQDTSPAFSENGSILFSSDRAAGDGELVDVGSGLEDEGCYKVSAPESPSLIHSVSLEGKNITQLTFGNNHDVKLTSLSDGKVAFIRWARTYELLDSCVDYMALSSISGMPDDDYFTQSQSLDYAPGGLVAPSLWSDEVKCAYSQASPIGPIFASNHYTILRISGDGSELDQIYKTVTVSDSEEEFVQINKLVQSDNGQIVALIKHENNYFSGGDILELQAPRDLSDEGSTIFANISPRSLTSDDINIYPGQVSEHGWYSAFWPYRDGTRRILVSWSQCTTEQAGVNAFCNGHDQVGEVEAQYGIWAYDPIQDTRLPIVRSKKDTLYTDIALALQSQRYLFPFDVYSPDYIDPVADSDNIICVDPGTQPGINDDIDSESAYDPVEDSINLHEGGSDVNSTIDTDLNMDSGLDAGMGDDGETGMNSDVAPGLVADPVPEADIEIGTVSETGTDAGSSETDAGMNQDTTVDSGSVGGVDSGLDADLGSVVEGVADNTEESNSTSQLNCDPDTFVNHGGYVSCIVHYANEQVSLGMMTHQQRVDVVRTAAMSGIGKSNVGTDVDGSDLHTQMSCNRDDFSTLIEFVGCIVDETYEVEFNGFLAHEERVEIIVSAANLN